MMLAHDAERPGMSVSVRARVHALVLPSASAPGRARAVAVSRAGAAVLLSALVAGCAGSSGLDTSGGSTTSPSGPTSTPASPAPTTQSSTASPSAASATSPADAAGAAVLADWRAYNQGFEHAIHTRSARVPAMLHYSTAKQQSEDRTRIQTMHSLNIVFKGAERLWVKDVTADARRATVRVCYRDDAGYYIYAATGRTVHSIKPRWTAYGFRMLHRGGRWLVDSGNTMKFSCKGAK
jgi:hypothetical protein